MKKKIMMKEDLKKVYNKKGYYAYIMACQNVKTWESMIKVGYTTNIYQRKSSLESNQQTGINYRILKTFSFDNPEDGYEMEIWLHRYCRALGGTIHGNDYFSELNYSDFDLDFLDKTAEKIKENSKKWIDKIK